MASRKPKVAKARPKVFISPYFSEQDKADGGIRRVVEAQRLLLPGAGIDVVNEWSEADLLAQHIYDDMPPGLRGPNRLTVSHNHGLYWEEYEWESWATEANFKVIDALERADAITAPTEWVSNIIRRGFMKPVYTIPHGVNIDEWEDYSDKEPVEPYVLWNKTRVDPVCDPRPLIELAKLVPSTLFKTTLAGKHALPSNVQTVGAMAYEYGKGLVQQAGVYLCTTRETFGIGTLEAMAAGVPILGWAWGGQRDIVVHGETGWLCAPGDFDGLAAGLEYCLRNRARLGKAARAHVAGNYTWQRAMELYAALYIKVIEENRPALTGLSKAVKLSRQSQELLKESSGAQSLPSEPPIGKGVSVVITNYKLERYLEQAIVSAKTHLPGAEVVVVDDCSPGDGTQITCEAIALAQGVRYERTPENLYLAGALNYGIARATGKYIIPLDADNYLEAGMVECVRKLKGTKAFDIAYGQVHFMDVMPDGSVMKEYGSEWPGQFSFPNQMQHQNQIPSTCVYRKSVWERVGGYRTRCKTAEDADFWCRATSFCGRPRKATDAVTFTYRNRIDSMSHVEADWPWNEWYSWSKRSRLTPMGAALTDDERRRYLKVPSLEPMLVSVIIPVGPGHQTFLPDAIDSVIAQTFVQWELIIVNDSGADLGWVPPFVKLVSTGSEGSRGTAAARNQGLSVAHGRAFLFLDADDYLQPEALEALYSVFRRPTSEGGGGIVYGDFYEQPEGKLHVWSHDTNDCTGLPVLQEAYLPITFLAPMVAVGRPSFGGSSSGAWFDEALDAWEDWDFLYQLHANGWCAAYVPRPIFNYRYHTGGRRHKAATDKAVKDRLVEHMAAKWKPYLVGHGILADDGMTKGKTLMACGGCRGGGRVAMEPAITMEQQMALINAQAGQQAGASVNGMVRVEYTGFNKSTVEYRGSVTGTTYRFGAGSSDKVNYVHAKDVPHFLELVGQFRLHGSDVSIGGMPDGSSPLLSPAR